VTVRVVATAGHVDHGKSTLVRALTGTDPDRFEEEKRRGLTIDLGFARLATASGTQVDLIDVPGHVRFIKNMLAGVGAIDACLLVVAATEGWKPQTEEHLRILELLGVRHGVVALTMAGLVDDEGLELARMDVEDHLAGTFLTSAEVVAVDAVADGLGIGDLRRALDRLVTAVPPAPDVGRPRLWIDRAFTVAGAGAVLTGTLTGGRLHLGDEVEVTTPKGARPARVRGLQAFGEDRTVLEPGCRAALNLAGVSYGVLRRGDAVIRPGQWHLTRSVDTSLTVLPTAPAPVRSRGAFFAHVGSGEHPVRLRVIGGTTIEPGHQGAVRLGLPVALPLLPGDRFVLRDSGSGTTVGGGEVLDGDPVLRPSRAAPTRSVDRVVAERGWVDVEDLERLTGERRPPSLGRWAVDPDALATARKSLRERVLASGAAGIDVALLDEQDRALLARDDQLTTTSGRARPAGVADPYEGHPFLAALAQAPFTPPPADAEGVERAEVRELARRGLVVERDGIAFHPTALDEAAVVAARLIAADPDGFTVAEFRDAVGTSRRFALPLLAMLDERGVTRRRGDRRIAGPRLPR
jgi:selenocysteine-specific elongation factor